MRRMVQVNSGDVRSTARKVARPLLVWGLDAVERALPGAAIGPLLPSLRRVHRFEISPEAMREARRRLPRKGRLLIFSLGRDSSMWELVNRNGRTAFVEDLEEWIAFSRKRAPRREVHKISYSTERHESLSYTSIKEIPLPTLPSVVEPASWDVVVVDGPKGSQDGQPGRASSIALAAKMVAPGGTVILDDFDREVEQHIAGLVFLRQPDRLIDPSRPCAVYHVPG